MTSPRFSKGDEVRVLASSPYFALHGKTGTVDRYSPSARFVRVQFSGWQYGLLVDSELELVSTLCQTCGDRFQEPECPYCQRQNVT